ncbi:uncharacterized protein LOC110932999 [Helianthus annuus]|uniref:uncharacterized protein LOC110932999 n=1 Tax=Helianthus annuus TaxID=4232 RepID=UPI000B907438|nr:uncharacterized protein LOC110932999 [Helianthus annuus]
MLSKWWWRFKANPLQLWSQFIASTHKFSADNQIIPVSKSIPGVWKDIGNVDSELQKLGLDIKQNLVVNNGVWKWRTESDDVFSVKQVRIDIEDTLGADPSCVPGFEWIPWAPPKANHLLWRAILGKVASRAGLARRGIPLSDVSCPRCGLALEDSDHIFFNCLWAKCVWWNVLSWIRISFPEVCDSLAALLSHIKEAPGGKIWKKLVRTIIVATTWRIWIARNAKVFDDCFIPIMKTVELVKEDAFLWICNRSKLKAPTWDKWRMFDVVEML